MADRLELDPPTESAQGGAAQGGGGGLKSFLPLIITVLLMPAIAWAMTSFVLVPKLQKSLGVVPPAPSEHAAQKAGEHENANAQKEPDGKGHGEKSGSKETVTMAKLLVNVSGTLGSRYLLASLTLLGAGPDFKTKIETHDAKLRDMACTALAIKTINDLEKPGARNLVRSELLTGFNNILGGNTVQEIYITEFAIQ